MWIISVPLVLVFFIFLALGIGIWNANLMPLINIICLISAIISLVTFFKQKENEVRSIAMVIAIISIIIFLCTLGGTMTTGNIISWIWYHI